MASSANGHVKTSDCRYLGGDAVHHLSNPNTTFVQIRPHHDIAGYELFLVERDFTLVRFRMTTAQMTAELEEMGLIAHAIQAIRRPATTVNKPRPPRVGVK